MRYRGLLDLKVGDAVVRFLAGTAPMRLRVTAIDDYIHCGDWKFHKLTGGEVDEDLGWDGWDTGSVLMPQIELD